MNEPSGNLEVCRISTIHPSSLLRHEFTDSRLSTIDLSEALDNANDPLAVVRAIRKLKHERLEQALSEMKEIAARRSGARGAKSRKDLISLEEQVAVSTSRHVIGVLQ